MKKRLIITGILIAYTALLIKVMVFKDVPLIRIGSLMIYFGGSQTGPANLWPFKTILVYLLGEKGLIIGGINLIGNIILLVPIGLLVPLAWKKITWKKMLAVAFIAGFAIEGMQVVLRVGIFDIDDVILNGLGVMVGYWIFTVLAKKVHSLKPKNITIVAALITVMVAATALYAVVAYRKGQLPVSFEPGPGSVQSQSFGNAKTGTLQSDDPCGGTGGTGQIVKTGNHSITIKGHDGKDQTIYLTKQTKIAGSAGPASESDLKKGVRVTIVTESGRTASVVLICNASIEEVGSGK